MKRLVAIVLSFSIVNPPAWAALPPVGSAAELPECQPGVTSTNSSPCKATQTDPQIAEESPTGAIKKPERKDVRLAQALNFGDRFRGDVPIDVETKRVRTIPIVDPAIVAAREEEARRKASERTALIGEIRTCASTACFKETLGKINQLPESEQSEATSAWVAQVKQLGEVMKKGRDSDEYRRFMAQIGGEILSGPLAARAAPTCGTDRNCLVRTYGELAQPTLFSDLQAQAKQECGQHMDQDP